MKNWSLISNSRSLKQIDAFKSGKSFNISRKKKSQCDSTGSSADAEGHHH
jgi:hypothetical protein